MEWRCEYTRGGNTGRSPRRTGAGQDCEGKARDVYGSILGVLLQAKIENNPGNHPPLKADDFSIDWSARKADRYGTESAFLI